MSSCPFDNRSKDSVNSRAIEVKGGRVATTSKYFANDGHANSIGGQEGAVIGAKKLWAGPVLKNSGRGNTNSLTLLNLLGDIVL